MPCNVMQNIVAKTEIISRFSLRKCSSALRKAVDTTHAEYFQVSFRLKHGMIEFQTHVDTEKEDRGSEEKQISVEYHSHPEGCVIRDGEREKMVEGSDYVTRAVSDLSTLFTNSLASIETLLIDIEDCSHNEDGSVNQLFLDSVVSFVANIQKALGQLEHKLNLQKLRIIFPMNMEQLSPLFSLFKQGVLDRMEIQSVIIDQSSDIDSSRDESMQRCIASLVHACQCSNRNCRRISCHKMKRVVQHTKLCKKRTRGTCPVCKQLIALCCYHAKHCTHDACFVPFCTNIRQKLAAQKRSRRADLLMKRRMERRIPCAEDISSSAVTN